MQSTNKINFGNLESLRCPSAQSPQMDTGATVTVDVQENYGWILHPSIDLIFVCGGLVWIFAALFATNLVNLVPGLNNLNSKAVETLNFAFFLVFVVPHGMATLLRVYDVPATRQASGMKVILLAVVCLLLLCIGCLSAFWASLIARMALCFSLQHGLGQAYGIALIYCYKRKFYLTKLEKRIFSLVIQAGILLGVTTVLGTSHLVFTNSTLVPLFPEFPSWVYQTCAIAVASAVLAFSIVLGRKFFVEKRLMPLPAILTIATGFIIFVIIIPLAYYLNSAPAIIPNAPQMVSWILLLYYGAHGLFHTPQYLVVTTAVHLKNRGWPESMPFSKISSQLFSRRALKYFFTVYALAWIYMCSSTFMGPLFIRIGLNHHPELWFLVFISCTNLHHYWSDAIIWKLKDKENLRLLIS